MLPWSTPAVRTDGTLTETNGNAPAFGPGVTRTRTAPSPYTELRGDVRLANVDFAYEEGKEVLHDVTVWAEPGQKVAFVGATGAGKTTITNLINRFYDIADGKIRYDGINITKIQKPIPTPLALGIVLQDVNLFTGTVMENIRYGKPGRHRRGSAWQPQSWPMLTSFIKMLPKGYNTVLSGDG